MGSKRKRSTHEAPVAAPAAKKTQKASEASAKRASTPPPLDASPFVDNAKGEDLRREVGLYDLLSSEDGTQRLNAARAIVSGLTDGEGVNEFTLQKHMERRLFRGLASGRKGARIGYSVVLTELLTQLFGPPALAETKYTYFTFDKMLDVLVEKTKPDGDLSGQEEKDHAFGLLFGLRCFVQSRILFSEEARWTAILDKLIGLSQKKPWIRGECGWVIVEALEQMQQKQAEATLEVLQQKGYASTPEAVGIWITAKERFPKFKFPQAVWGKNGNPLDHLKELAKALKESSSNDDAESGQQVKQTGNWNPQLHFVWNIVLGQYAKLTKSDGDFGKFWKVAVDDNLFSATASRERKYWGFLIFQKMCHDFATNETMISAIFSHNLVRCLINHVQEKDRFLHRVADKSLKVLVSAVEAHPSLLPIVLEGLVDGNGSYSFDKVTKTKTVEKLLALVNNENARAVIAVLFAPTIEMKSSEAIKDAEARRHVFGDYLLALIRRVDPKDAHSTAAWVADTAFPRLAEYAYSVDSTFKPVVAESTRTLFRNRLMSAFAHLLGDLEGYIYPCDLILSCTPDAVTMDSGITDAKDRAISTLQKLMKKANKAPGKENSSRMASSKKTSSKESASNKVSGREQTPYQALALLYALVIFQLYNGEPEAVEILDGLKQCYEELIKQKSGANDGEALEVLVETLLSFISKPSALLRKVTQHVFGAFIGEMTAGGLKLMTDILASSESLRGQQQLFDEEPEDGDMEVDDDQDEEMDSDVEVVDMNGDEGHLHPHLDDDDDDDEDEDEDEDESEEEEEEDDDDEESRKLDAALALALGTHRLDEDAGASSESDADMSDSEMLALDNKLIEIFSQRKAQPNKKREQKEAKETMVAFKARVLDLLELYIKKQARNPLALTLLLPLLQCMRTTQTKTLADKAHALISAFGRSAKRAAGEKSSSSSSSSSSSTAIAPQVALLRAIHAEAARDPAHSYAKAASTASLLVATSLYRAGRENVQVVAEVYAETFVGRFGGGHVQASLFTDFANWGQSHWGVEGRE